MTTVAVDEANENKMLLSRFKGAMVGAVVADCIGSCYEGMASVKVADVLAHFNKLKSRRHEQREKGTRPADVYGIRFTDDTAMARSIMDSLVEKNFVDTVDLAKRFTEAYFTEPDRGYGGNIITVFEKLKSSSYTDVFKPARDQFEGSGSYGNGGAMRIVPAPLYLFSHNNVSELETVTSSITRLTHTHPEGVNGAILQAFAVDLSLRLSQAAELDTDRFCDELIQRLRPIEDLTNKQNAIPPPAKKVPPKRKLDADPHPFCAKLEKVKEFVKTKELSPKTVETILGNDVSALGSVPAAVLSFLRGISQSIAGVEEDNPFKRVVLYAISLGGDTDTIATMAAAMAGGYLGLEKIPEEWQYYSEGVAEAETAAEKLLSLTQEWKRKNCDTAL